MIKKPLLIKKRRKARARDVSALRLAIFLSRSTSHLSPMTSDILRSQVFRRIERPTLEPIIQMSFLLVLALLPLLLFSH